MVLTPMSLPGSSWVCRCYRSRCQRQQYSLGLGKQCFPARGSTAQNLIETVLKAKGVTYNGSQSGEYWFLNSINSPFDHKPYAWDAATNKYWHLYINGEPSLLCANQITLKSGDKVTLAYTTDDSAMPDPDKIVVDPSATTPDWDAEWAGYGNSGNGST